MSLQLPALWYRPTRLPILEDLKAATGQTVAMEKASASLTVAVEKALEQSRDARAFSVYPEIKKRRPTATVTLLQGGRFETVTEPLR